MVAVNTCLQGDVRQVLPELLLGGLEVQCVVTSPPYWRLRDYGHPDQLGQEDSPEKYIGEMVKVFDLVKRLLRPDGVMWLNVGDTYSASRSAHRFDNLHPSAVRGPGVPDGLSGLPGKNLLGLPWRLALALQSRGWIIRADCIWHKPSPMPESVKDRPTRSHEHVFLMSKSLNYYYDWEAVAEPAGGDHPRRQDKEFQAPGQARHKGLRKKALKKRSVRESVDLRGGNQGNGLMSWDLEFRNLRDVWTVPTESHTGKNHYASFPRRLAEICIKAGSRPGDIVFDPFMGSGTVAEVAENLGRQWAGVELNPDYIDLQHKRLAKVNPLLRAANI